MSDIGSDVGSTTTTLHVRPREAEVAWSHTRRKAPGAPEARPHQDEVYWPSEHDGRVVPLPA